MISYAIVRERSGGYTWTSLIDFRGVSIGDSTKKRFPDGKIVFETTYEDVEAGRKAEKRIQIATSLLNQNGNLPQGYLEHTFFDSVETFNYMGDLEKNIE